MFLKEFLKNSEYSLIGVTGGAGAGKTSLCQKLGIDIVHADDFFFGDSDYRKDLLDRKSKDTDSTISISNMYSWWNWDKLEAELLSVRSPTVLEGALLGPPPILNLLERIFIVHVPREERFKRLRERDKNKRDFMESLHRFLITECSEGTFYKFLLENYRDKITILNRDYSVIPLNEKDLFSNEYYLPIKVHI